LVLRATWTFLVLAVISGALEALTAARGGSGHLLLESVGLVAGACVAVGVSGSALGRKLTAIVLGALTLPLLAVHLAAASVRSEAELGAEMARLVPFLAYAAGALLAGVAASRIWRGRPVRPPAEDAPESGDGQAGAAQQRAARAAQEVST
jgi:hypothetical protein